MTKEIEGQSDYNDRLPLSWSILGLAAAAVITWALLLVGGFAFGLLFMYITSH